MRRCVEVEEDGTTFGTCVLDQRLRHAYAILVDARYDHMTIAATAFHVAFGDLSAKASRNTRGQNDEVHEPLVAGANALMARRMR